MAKKISPKPDWLGAPAVEDILSVSSCVSEDFAEWIGYWEHNGYWFFDSPAIIRRLAIRHQVDLSGCRWFYYEAFGQEYDDKAACWRTFGPDQEFQTAVELPPSRTLLGFDVVTFSNGNSAECSPLSCNHRAETVAVNRHCLLDSLAAAEALVDDGTLVGCEPGPLRIFAVYEVFPPLGRKG